MTKAHLLDIGERAGWTGLQAALGIGIAELSDVSLWWAAPAALILSAAKTWVVGRLSRGA